MWALSELRSSGLQLNQPKAQKKTGQNEEKENEKLDEIDMVNGDGDGKIK